MYYLMFFVGFMIASGIVSFTLIPILIILRFGIPNTIFLQNCGNLKKDNKIIRGYLVSILILGFIYSLILIGLKSFSQTLFNGYILGTVFVLVLGFGKTGNNPENASEYLETNKDKFI